MGGGCPNSIYLRVLWKLLSIFTNIVLFFYLGVATLIPSLVLLRRDPRGLGRRRGLCWTLVEAAPPIVHHAVEHDGGIREMNEFHRLARNMLSPLIATMILASLFSVVIQAEFMEAEVSATSCLEPAHSGAEGCVLQS